MVTIPAEDHLAIQELAYRYAYHADRKEWDAVLDLFVDDCLFDETSIGIPLMDGKDAIRAYFNGDLIASVDYFVHYVTNHIILDYSGDHARGTCYILGTGKLKDGTKVDVTGHKDDEYVKVEGRWRFKTRVFKIFSDPEGLG